jgi:formate-dependent nitrite reductase membrane component NrfD
MTTARIFQNRNPRHSESREDKKSRGTYTTGIVSHSGRRAAIIHAIVHTRPILWRPGMQPWTMWAPAFTPTFFNNFELSTGLNMVDIGTFIVVLAFIVLIAWLTNKEIHTSNPSKGNVMNSNAAYPSVLRNLFRPGRPVPRNWSA